MLLPYQPAWPGAVLEACECPYVAMGQNCILWPKFGLAPDWDSMRLCFEAYPMMAVCAGTACCQSRWLVFVDKPSPTWLRNDTVQRCYKRSGESERTFANLEKRYC